MRFIFAQAEKQNKQQNKKKKKNKNKTQPPVEEREDIVEVRKRLEEERKNEV